MKNVTKVTIMSSVVCENGLEYVSPLPEFLSPMRHFPLVHVILVSLNCAMKI